MKSSLQRALVIDTITDIASGYIGAAQRLLRLLIELGDSRTMQLMGEMRKADIRGARIIMLYDYICGQDIEKLQIVLMQIPTEIVGRECAKEDGSGKAFIDEYLQTR